MARPSKTTWTKSGKYLESATLSGDYDGTPFTYSAFRVARETVDGKTSKVKVENLDDVVKGLGFKSTTGAVNALIAGRNKQLRSKARDKAKLDATD